MDKNLSVRWIWTTILAPPKHQSTCELSDTTAHSYAWFPSFSAHFIHAMEMAYKNMFLVGCILSSYLIGAYGCSALYACGTGIRCWNRAPSVSMGWAIGCKACCWACDSTADPAVAVNGGSSPGGKFGGGTDVSGRGADCTSWLCSSIVGVPGRSSTDRLALNEPHKHLASRT